MCPDSCTNMSLLDFELSRHTSAGVRDTPCSTHCGKYWMKAYFYANLVSKPSTELFSTMLILVAYLAFVKLKANIATTLSCVNSE